MIKFKEAGNEEYITIFLDESGKEIDRTPSWNKKNKPGFYQEMMDWVEAGNEIEPQFTAEELAEKEAKEKLDALESQKQTCINLLHETQHKVNGDYDFPLDVTTWLRWREIIKTIMRGSELKRIPDKPVF